MRINPSLFNIFVRQKCKKYLTSISDGETSSISVIFQTRRSPSLFEELAI